MSTVLGLPDDICLVLLSVCTCASRLSLEATCRRMRQLLQLPAAWPLELGVQSRLADGQRMAVEAVHAARTDSVLRALVDELMHRNDPERNVWHDHVFAGDPLAGRDPYDAPRVHSKLFEHLCEACRRGPATTIAALRTLHQIVLVVELRRFSDRASCTARQCWSWVVQPSADDVDTDEMFGQIHVAAIEVATDEMPALPFDDNTFIVVWAVHRATKAVALVHAAAPEGGGSAAAGCLRPGIGTQEDELPGEWHAASLLPRWHPQACEHKVTGLMEIHHRDVAAHRDSLTLSEPQP
jgi:hypothetical protein